MEIKEIHIGSLIQKKLKEERQTASWLAKKIGCECANIYKIFEKSHIDTLQLQIISKALETDFFAYYSENQ